MDEPLATPTVATISTTDVDPTPPSEPSAGVAAAVNPGAERLLGGSPPQPGSKSDPVRGIGTAGELDVWTGGYSMRNYLGRLVFAVLLSLAWCGLAVSAWGYEHAGRIVWAKVTGVVLLLIWLSTGIQMLRARLSYKYHLTTRRLFVSTGISHRERDQIELLRVQDVFTSQQSLLQRLVDVGTIRVVTSDKSMPNYALVGVDSPKATMDLIWNHVRAEQDQRNIRIERT
jgi:membrane protein YdbS with pleckstrin-like domain